MRRNIVRVKLEDFKVRYNIHLEDDDHPCEVYANNYRYLQHFFLKTLVDNQILLECGPGSTFETMKVYHNGVCWAAELESVVEEDLTGQSLS